MADFTKLNGYDVKDTTARNDISDINTNIGDLTDLTTTEKSSVVGAINEVDGDVGNLSSLTTTEKSSVVGAINEVDGDIGNLSSLTTTEKSSVVGAINEVKSSVPTNTSQLNNNSGFTTQTTMTVSNMDVFKAYCINTAPNGISFYNVWIEGGAQASIILQKTSSTYLSYIYFNYYGDVFHDKYYEGTWTSNDLG